jgi:tyrosyl-tRNA synthetase
MLTLLPVDQIDETDKWEGGQLNRANEILASDLTELVHGREEAERAEASAKALFGSGEDAEIPTSVLSESDLDADGRIDIISVLVKAGLFPSRSEGRRAVEQGGVTADGEKVTDFRASFGADELRRGIVVRRGKKAYKKVTL